MLSEWLLGAVCYLSLLMVVVTAIYRTLRGSKPDKPTTPLGQLAAVPSLRSLLVGAVVAIIVSALFFLWLMSQWHHGPAP